MRLEHIYWVAAFLDGEGHFGFYHSSPVIDVVSTDRDIIDKFLNFSHLDQRVYTYSNSPFKTRYQVRIQSTKAIEWMMTIYSLMCERRREKIKEVISAWKLTKPYNGEKTHCPNGHLYSGRNLIIEMNGGRRCRICRLQNQRNRTVSRRLENSA